MSTLAGQSRTPGLNDHRSTDARVFEPWVLVAAFVAICGALWFAFPHFFRAQVLLAWERPSDWGHTFVVPLIALWFIWLRRDELFAKPMDPAWVGLLFILLGIAFYMMGSVGPKQLIHHLTRAFGVFVTAFGLIVLLMGWRSLRVLGFPLVYMFAFGVVISDRIMTPVTYTLQDISAKGAWLVLTVMGFDADLSGNTLTVFDQGQSFPLNVAEACSGMRMLVAFLALGTAMAYVGLSRVWQRSLLILLGVPVAIFVNVLRVVTLGLLSREDVHLAAGDFHTFIGLVWLIPAFMVFIFLMWIVRKLVVEPPKVHAPAEGGEYPTLRFARSLLPKVVVSIVALVVGAIIIQWLLGFLNVFLAKKPIPLRASLDTIPMTLGPWVKVGDEPEYDAAIVETLGTTQFIDRFYALNGNPEDGMMAVHIAYYSGTIDDVPHIPERCWDAAGLKQMGDSDRIPLELDESSWSMSDQKNLASGEFYNSTIVKHPVTGYEQEVLLPVGDVALTTSVFGMLEQPDARRVGGYFFVANGRLCSSSFRVRSLAFNWTDEYAYYCKVQFSALYNLPKDGETFLDDYQASSEDLAGLLLPHVMRCLPDWGDFDVQATGDSSADDSDWKNHEES